MPDDSLYRKVLAKIEAEATSPVDAYRMILKEVMEREAAAEAKLAEAAKLNQSSAVKAEAAEKMLRDFMSMRDEVLGLIEQHNQNVASQKADLQQVREAVENIPAPAVTPPTDLSPVLQVIASSHTETLRAVALVDGKIAAIRIPVPVAPPTASPPAPRAPMDVRVTGRDGNGDIASFRIVTKH